MSRITKKESIQNLNDVIKSKKIGNNTFEIDYNNGNKAIRLHCTDVITFKANGNIVLNTDGWKTSTTKNRINNYLNGFKVYQQKSNWFIVKIGNWENPIAFYDGMEFNSNMELISENKTIDTKKQNTLKRKIKNYCNLLDKMESLPFPNNGDCFYCLMTTSDKKTLGDCFKDKSHLLRHIEENYLHGSILVNAMLESGWDKQRIGLHYQLNSKDIFKRALKKYLVKRLITN